MLNLNAQINDVIINQDSKGMESFISAGKEFEIIFERMTMLEFQEMMISRTKGKTDSEIADISTGNMNFYEISKIFSLRVKSWRGIAINSEELKLNKKNKDLLIEFAPEFISAVMSIYLDEIMSSYNLKNKLTDHLVYSLFTSDDCKFCQSFYKKIKGETPCYSKKPLQNYIPDGNQFKCKWKYDEPEQINLNMVESIIRAYRMRDVNGFVDNSASLNYLTARYPTQLVDMFLDIILELEIFRTIFITSRENK